MLKNRDMASWAAMKTNCVGSKREMADRISSRSHRQSLERRLVR